MAKTNLEHRIPGDYQLNAMLHGWRLQRAWHRSRLDLLMHLLPPPPAGFVLDAACGAGIVTWFFREPRIVSVDMRFDACRAVRTHTHDARSTVGMLDALPFQNGAFVQAYFLEAIEHLGKEEGHQALRELYRVCRPGARCLVTTPNYISHWPMVERIIDALRLTPHMRGGQHVMPYDTVHLKTTAEASGWRVLRVGSFNLAAPFAGLLSARLARRVGRLEAATLRRGGALLFAVCERP